PGAVMAEQAAPPIGEAWGDTTLVLPERLAGAWVDALTGQRHRPDGGRLQLADLLATLPVALLVPDADEGGGAARR
ncbi:MAG: hypothetical protein R6T85_04505, partial [Egibacteraceae bacterium]